MSDTSRALLKFVASAVLGFGLTTFAHGLLPPLGVIVGTLIGAAVMFLIGANSDELAPVIVCIVGMFLAAILGVIK